MLWMLTLLYPLIFGSLTRVLDELPMWVSHPISMMRHHWDRMAAARAEDAHFESAQATEALKRKKRKRARRHHVQHQRSVRLGHMEGLHERLAESEEEDIARALADSASAFSWTRGDILLIDNRAMLHDGLPGFGPRRLHVALLADDKGMDTTSLSSD